VIDFRYHLVSIIAVFLALALGMIIGTAALNGAVLNDLEKRVDNLQSENSDLEDAVSQAEAETAAGDAYAEESQPFVLPGRLGGQTVLLVVTPGADAGQVDAAEAALVAAGSSLTGALTIDPSYAEQANAQALLDLVPQLVPEGIEVPATADPYEQVAALLSAVLIANSNAAAAPPGQIGSVLAGLEGLGVLDATEITAPATMAVTVAGAPLRDEDQARALNEALLPLLEQLDAAGVGSLLAGPTESAEADGLVGEARSSNVKDSVSTVDNLQSSVGQTSVATGLQLDGAGTVGQYGTANGATAPVPPLD
jgi:hypothetical protein